MLKTAGQIAGIGGLAIGMLVLIFRDVIRKKIFPKLSREQAYSLLRLILILAWSVALVGIAAWVYTNHSPPPKPEPTAGKVASANQPPPVDGLIKAARLQREAKDYEGGWKLLSDALKLQPESLEVKREQVQLAMDWLRNIHALEPHTFTEYVNQVLPSLYEGAGRETGTLAADIYAHIGWANFLKFRDNDRHLEIEEQYKKALSLDPDNPYAHTMWGHWILSEKEDGKLSEAQQHFASALKTGRDRPYVRELQFTALQWGEKIEDEIESIRVGNEMRKNGEVLPLKIKESILEGVYLRRFREEIWNRLPSILPPAEHLATFNWFTDGVERLKRFPYSYEALIQARLTEAAGDYAKALSLYVAYGHGSFGYGSGTEVSEGIARCREHLPQAKSEVQYFIDATKDKNPVLRERAVRSLSEFKTNVTEILPALMAALGDENAGVRGAAAEKLAQIGGAVVPQLTEMLASKDNQEVHTALGVLKNIGADAKAAVPSLIKLLPTQDKDIRSETISALGAMGADAKLAVPGLIEVLQHDSDDTLREVAAYYLGEIGPDARGAVPALIERFKDKKNDGGGFRGQSAAEALGKIGPAAKSAVPALIEGLREDDRLRVPFSSAIALGKIGAAAKAAIPALVESMQSVEKDAIADRAEAIGLIAQDLMAQGDTASIPVLSKALRAMEDGNLESKLTGPVREALDSLRDKAAAK